jgi:hypothetical protein
MSHQISTKTLLLVGVGGTPIILSFFSILISKITSHTQGLKKKDHVCGRQKLEIKPKKTRRRRQ